MQKTTFISDGQTKVFYFTFPFFLKSDVIIEVDDKPATNYNLICVKNGLNPDVPFTGGAVHFACPPKAASVINIWRKLPIKRIVDYQTMAPYSPITHNQDMNYVIEILKDMQAAVDSVLSMPTDGANKDAIVTINKQIAQMITTIDELKSAIDNVGDIDLSEIHGMLENLANSIGLLNARVTQMAEQIENLPTDNMPDNADYVVESQVPTSTDSTWYRKYKSGWVEQGGTASSQTVTLPVKMANTNYSCLINVLYNNSSSALWRDMGYLSIQETDRFRKAGDAAAFRWVVYGEYAQ